MGVLYFNRWGCAFFFLGALGGLVVAFLADRFLPGALKVRGFNHGFFFFLTLAVLLLLADLGARIVALASGKNSARGKRTDGPGVIGALFLPSCGGHLSFIPCWVAGLVCLGVPVYDWVQAFQKDLREDPGLVQLDPQTTLTAFQAQMAQGQTDVVYTVVNQTPYTMTNVKVSFRYIQGNYGTRAAAEAGHWPTWQPGETKTLQPLPKSEHPGSVYLTGSADLEPGVGPGPPRQVLYDIRLKLPEPPGR
jgi:hypothetical protein